VWRRLLPEGKGKTHASRASFYEALSCQQVVRNAGLSTACLPLRQKLTGEAPPWGAGRVSARPAG
jgi:hypothetical protein